MNILIIATFFPPDSTIAAIRPYMFAKHLAAMGENVTVMRTGFFDQKPFDEYRADKSFEVLSALGINCPAEKFERGEDCCFTAPPPGRFQSLPQPVKLPLKAVRDGIYVLRGKPPKYFRAACTSLKYQKRLIDRMYGRNRHFDVVFSTCGELENIYAGKYAAEKFGAKWIMDFRDSMLFKSKGAADCWRSVFGKDATLCALNNADVVTAVSEGLRDELHAMYPAADTRVLYNGFDETEAVPDAAPEKDTLSFCYTGRLYEDRLPVLKDLASAFSKLINNGSVDRNKIRFYYAGSSAKDILKIFSKAGVQDILDDRGYLSKTETLKLQLSADVFTVLSWNTRSSKGILTGKFYEGIKAGKPIFALVSGSEPNSELLQLQNKYNYGFCFEQAERKTSLPALEDYILRLYNEKMSAGRIEYKPSRELYSAFSYSSLSEKLHDIMFELTANNNSEGSV